MRLPQLKPWRAVSLFHGAPVQSGQRTQPGRTPTVPNANPAASRATSTLAQVSDAASAADASALERLMQRPRLTHIAQEMWQQVCRPGDTVVDATCGNGQDTLCLARMVGRTGSVWAFDVQEIAIAATRARLQQELPAEEWPALNLQHESHAAMQGVVGSGVARLVVFNLGYLPGGDKSVTTQEGSTVQALQAAAEVLCPGGLLSVLAYVGHEGGAGEYEAARQVVADLPPAQWVSSQLQLLNRPTAPVLLLAWKRLQQ